MERRAPVDRARSSVGPYTATAFPYPSLGGQGQVDASTERISLAFNHERIMIHESSMALHYRFIGGNDAANSPSDADQHSRSNLE